MLHHGLGLVHYSDRDFMLIIRKYLREKEKRVPERGAWRPVRKGSVGLDKIWIINDIVEMEIAIFYDLDLERLDHFSLWCKEVIHLGKIVTQDRYSAYSKVDIQKPL